MTGFLAGQMIECLLAKETSGMTASKSDELNTIGFIGDWHCGCHSGLYPPDRWNEHTPRAIQWLWECYEHMVQSWPRLDLLIFTGDLIDGTQSKARGTGLHTSDMSEQVEIAIDCALPITKKARAIRRVEGTSYHEGFEGSMKYFDMTYGIKIQHGVRAVVQDIRLANGEILNVKHEPEGNRPMYLGTALDRELRNAILACANSNTSDANYFVRGHLHQHAEYHQNERHLYITPCFSLQNKWAVHKGFYKWRPSIGGLLARKVPDRYGGGYRFVPTLYDLPHLEIESYGDILDEQL